MAFWGPNVQSAQWKDRPRPWSTSGEHVSQRPPVPGPQGTATAIKRFPPGGTSGLTPVGEDLWPDRLRNGSQGVGFLGPAGKRHSRLACTRGAWASCPLLPPPASSCPFLL